MAWSCVSAPTVVWVVKAQARAILLRGRPCAARPSKSGRQSRAQLLEQGCLRVGQQAHRALAAVDSGADERTSANTGLGMTFLPRRVLEVGGDVRRVLRPLGEREVGDDGQGVRLHAAVRKPDRPAVRQEHGDARAVEAGVRLDAPPSAWWARHPCPARPAPGSSCRSDAERDAARVHRALDERTRPIAVLADDRRRGGEAVERVQAGVERGDRACVRRHGERDLVRRWGSGCRWGRE